MLVVSRSRRGRARRSQTNNPRGRSPAQVRGNCHRLAALILSRMSRRGDCRSLVLCLRFRNEEDGGDIEEMTVGGLLQRWWFRAILVVSAWTVFAVFLSSQMYLAYSRGKLPIQYQRIFLVELVYAYLWAVLTPLILWLARRFPIERKQWLRIVMIHLGASLLIGFATRGLHDLMLFFFLAGGQLGSPALGLKYFRFSCEDGLEELLEAVRSA